MILSVERTVVQLQGVNALPLSGKLILLRDYLPVIQHHKSCSECALNYNTRRLQPVDGISFPTASQVVRDQYICSNSRMACGSNNTENT